MFGRPTTRGALRPLVGDLRQLASVRRIVLDDGPERGVRALAFSTGGGLDFWVLSDRSLDLGPLWWRGVPIAWQGPAGFRGPALTERWDDAGRGMERGFSGMMVTCGLEHIRKPADGVLHGHLPFTPARVTAYGEDWDGSEPLLFCEGEVTQARLGGEALRLHRRIEAPVGRDRLRILDRVENLGPQAQPLALLYHFNFGFPALAQGSRLHLNGTALPILGEATLGASVTCMPAGKGWARCTLATPLAGDSGLLEATVGFDAATLPFLQVWQDVSPATRVLGVEPCTSERLETGESGAERLLPPGAQRQFRLEFSVASSWGGPGAEAVEAGSLKRWP